MVDQLTLFDLDSNCGRTSQVPLQVRAARTSKPSSPKSSASSSRMLPMCLCLRGGVGAKADVSTMSWETGALLGEYTTRSFGEYPKEENASRLSQILEALPHPKYCLSARACQGILNRAIRRGKELPTVLRMALERQSASKNEPGSPAVEKES